MANVMLILLVTLLILYIILQDILHARERKDLYDRIMSKDLEDYRNEQEDDTPPRTVENIIKKSMREAQERTSRG